MGRRSKYTPELVERLLAAMADGMTDGHACVLVGITEATFYAWQSTKPAFAEQVREARVKGWLADLQVIKRAASEGDWRAAGEHLDRTRSPYRKSQETILSGPDGTSLVIEFRERPDGQQ